jgi:ribosomal protein L7/L12
MDLHRLLADLDNQIASLKQIRANVAFAIEQQTGVPTAEAGDTYPRGWNDLRTPDQQQWQSPTYKVGGKIDIIKVVREVTRLGLKEAKEGVESCGPTNPFPLGYQTADKIARLREVGCVVEVRA